MPLSVAVPIVPEEKGKGTFSEEVPPSTSKPTVFDEELKQFLLQRFEAVDASLRRIVERQDEIAVAVQDLCRAVKMSGGKGQSVPVEPIFVAPVVIPGPEAGKEKEGKGGDGVDGFLKPCSTERQDIAQRVEQTAGGSDEDARPLTVEEEKDLEEFGKSLADIFEKNDEHLDHIHMDEDKIAEMSQELLSGNKDGEDLKFYSAGESVLKSPVGSKKPEATPMMFSTMLPSSPKADQAMPPSAPEPITSPVLEEIAETGKDAEHSVTVHSEEEVEEMPEAAKVSRSTSIKTELTKTDKGKAVDMSVPRKKRTKAEMAIKAQSRPATGLKIIADVRAPHTRAVELPQSETDPFIDVAGTLQGHLDTLAMIPHLYGQHVLLMHKLGQPPPDYGTFCAQFKPATHHVELVQEPPVAKEQPLLQAKEVQQEEQEGRKKAVAKKSPKPPTSKTKFPAVHDKPATVKPTKKRGPPKPKHAPKAKRRMVESETDSSDATEAEPSRAIPTKDEDYITDPDEKI